MVGKTHVVVGVATYTVISGFNPIGIIISAVASKLPDIDYRFWHRGCIHSPLFLAILYFLVRQFCPEIVMPLLIGFLSHLILDSLTPMGIPWLWPFYPKRIGISLIPTGSIGDRLLRWASTAFLLFLIGNSIFKI
jgi:membrane-bound metal-dependent hydrolase YbcI (DUF457 family)